MKHILKSLKKQNLKIMSFVNELSYDIKNNNIIVENDFNKNFYTLKELMNGK